MKKVYQFIAVAAMLFFIIAILITSVWLAVYGDSSYRFYEKEYRKYTVTDALDMKMEDVMDVTSHMMDYLIGKEEQLSVITDVDGKRQDFFNEQDRLHMEDVKNLFLGGIKTGVICLLLSAVLVVLLRVKESDWGHLLSRAYSAALGIFLGIIVFLGAAFTIDFTRCFTIFHEIFFTNDLWLFDEETDYMIRMLPEGFFADMAMRIGLIFVAALFIVWCGFYIWKKKIKKIDKKQL